MHPKPFGPMPLRGAVAAASVLLGAATAAWAVTPAPPVGMARIWFYRDYQPSVSLNVAPVALNGTTVAYVPPDGTSLYRDVPPGHYRISVSSDGKDQNQEKDIDLAAGQEAFVKVVPSNSWIEARDWAPFHRDQFHLSLVPAQVARPELSKHPLYGG